MGRSLVFATVQSLGPWNFTLAAGDRAADNAPMPGRISSAAFVGRHAELRRLEALLASVISDETFATVLIGGEAGVGKTRLLSEFRASAEASGARYLAGACVDLGEGARPYDPLVAALRPWLRSLDRDEFRRIVGPARDEILRLVPGLAAADERQSAPDPVTPSTQSLLFLNLLGLIERLAAETPTVIALEDLHWADRSTRDMLHFLVRNIDHGRVMLVGTYRTDELNERHPLFELLAELQRTGLVERLDLARFSRREVSEQLAGILGRSPSGALVAQIYERGGGNPFFNEELLVAAERGEDRLGLTLRETLLARVGTLSAPSRDVLRVVAVAGPSARHDVLERVTGMPPDELAAALREAVDRHLLVAGDDEAMHFRHALLQEAVYEELLPGERLALHARVAEAVEGLRAAADSDARVASELAHHWYEARDARRALPALLRAGQAAERVFAFGNAFAHYHLALSLWPSGGPDLDGMTRRELVTRTAEAAALSGAYDRAIDLAQGALIEAADAERNPVEVGMLLERLAAYHLGAGDSDAAEPVARQALDLLPADPPSVARARVMGALAKALGLQSRFAESNDLAQTALSVARMVESEIAQIRALGCLGRNAASVGDTVTGVRTLREALALARSVGNLDDAAEISIDLAQALHWACDLGEACSVADEGIRESGRWGTTGFAGALRAVRGVCAFRLGRWSEAEDWIGSALEHDPVGSPGVLAHVGQALLDIGRGRLDSAADHLEIVLLMCQRVTAVGWTELYSTMALLSTWRGRPNEALESIRENIARSADPERDIHMRTSYVLGVRAAADLAEVARPTGDAAALERALADGREFDERLARHAELVRAMPGGGDPHLALDETLSKAELSRLEGPSSPDRWATAADAADTLRHPYDVAYCRYRQAEALLLSRGSRSEIQSAVREAHRTAIEMGASLLQREIEGLAGRSRIALDADEAEEAAMPPADAIGPGGRFKLTRREQDVLERLVSGHTNRDIASELFISEKTASVHISNIKSKLGANGRAEIAAIAVRLHLVDSADGQAALR
jgi:DNA-binding CsgD family transcriptional regulator/tetratricopeptide (TPR) repeat protein